MLAQLMEHMGIAAWLQNVQQLWDKAALQAVLRGAGCRTRRGPSAVHGCRTELLVLLCPFDLFGFVHFLSKGL